jgi:integrase/recombinase XerC
MIIPRAAEAASALPEFAPAGPELAVQARDWLAHLTGERRVSPHTAASYARDLRQFLHFAAVHFGKPASLATFTSLTAADLRAFLAARRGTGAGSRSLARQLAGLRSFARFLERNGHGQVLAFTALHPPKIQRGLPKPLRADAACLLVQVEARAGEDPSGSSRAMPPFWRCSMGRACASPKPWRSSAPRRRLAGTTF